MSNIQTNSFIIPPGNTILEILSERGITQAEFAKRLGRPVKFVNEIIKGKAAITPETALQLEKVLDISSQFWNKLESNYRDAIEREKESKVIKKEITLSTQFPVREMRKLKWIPDDSSKEKIVENLLSFFGVISLKFIVEQEKLTTPVALRISQTRKYNKNAIISWLRQGAREGALMETNDYDNNKVKECIPKIKSLTRENPKSFYSKLVKILSDCGIAFTVTPHLTGAPINGSSIWLTPNKALIQISLRYNYNDHFWFNILHEIGHIYLHSKKEYNIDFNKEKIDLKKENEADTFAADALINPQKYREFKKSIFSDSGVVSDTKISQFANTNGIHPSIVVGRLQHDHIIPFNRNGLKERFVLKT